MIEQKQPAADQVAEIENGSDTPPTDSSESSESGDSSEAVTPGTPSSMHFPENDPTTWDYQPKMSNLVESLDLACASDTIVYQKVLMSNGILGWLDAKNCSFDLLTWYFFDVFKIDDITEVKSVKAKDLEHVAESAEKSVPVNCPSNVETSGKSDSLNTLYMGPPVPCSRIELAEEPSIINDDGRFHPPHRSHVKPLVGVSPLWKYESADGEVSWPGPPRCYFTEHTVYEAAHVLSYVRDAVRTSSFEIVESVDFTMSQNEMLARQSTVRIDEEQESPKEAMDQEDTSGTMSKVAHKSDSSEVGLVHEPVIFRPRNACTQTLPSNDAGDVELSSLASEDLEEQEFLDADDEDPRKLQQRERPQSYIGHRDDGFNTPEHLKGQYTVIDEDFRSPERSPILAGGVFNRISRRRLSIPNLMIIEEASEAERESDTEEDKPEKNDEDFDEAGDVISAVESREESWSNDGAYAFGRTFECQTSVDDHSSGLLAQEVPVKHEINDEDTDLDDTYFYTSSPQSTAEELLYSSCDKASWVDEAVNEAEQQNMHAEDQLELIERAAEIPSIESILARLRYTCIPKVVVTSPDSEDDVGKQPTGSFGVGRTVPVALRTYDDFLTEALQQIVAEDLEPDSVSLPSTVSGERDPTQYALDEVQNFELGETTNRLASCMVEFESPTVKPIQDRTTGAPVNDIAIKDIVEAKTFDTAALNLPGNKKAFRSPDEYQPEEGLSNIEGETSCSLGIDAAPVFLNSEAKHDNHLLEYDEPTDLPLELSFNEFFFGTSTIAIGHKAIELGRSVWENCLKW